MDTVEVEDFTFLLGFLGVAFLFGLLINVPAVLVYTKSKQLRGATDKFIFFVLSVDVISLFVFLPLSFFAILQTSNGGQVLDVSSVERPLFEESAKFGQNGILADKESKLLSSHCIQQWIFIAHKTVFLMIANLSMLGALKIAVERYLAVVTPLHYHKLLKSFNVLLASFISFFISIACALLVSIIPEDDLLQFAPTHLIQVTSHHSKDELSNPMRKLFQKTLDASSESLSFRATLWYPVLKLAHVIVFFILPLIVLIFMYLRIWIEARKQNARITMMGHNPNTFILPGGTSDSKKAQEGTESSLHSIVGKFNFVQRIRQRTRMDRAARVAILTIGLLLICYGPLFSTEVVSALLSFQNFYRMKSPSLESQVKSRKLVQLVIPTLFACLHPLLSPLVYIYRYKKVRTELLSIVKNMISSFDCCNRNLNKGNISTCQDALYQINELAQKLPSPQICDEVSSNLSNETAITIDSSQSPSPCSSSASLALENVKQEGSECGDEEISAQSNSGLLYIINSWVHSYSRRWNHHRESVTSTTSVVTLLSNRSRYTIPSDES